ncbi:MAG: dCTP deaminase [Alphaproteobacteria bacterium]|nr:dCTP deaminase [Alphaproteobacteria bacterium]
MKLSDRDILKRIEERSIEIDPAEKVRFGPVSIDLTLDSRFLYFKHEQLSVIDVDKGLGNQDPMAQYDVPENEAFILQPKAFALGATKERVKIPDDLVGWLDGRSSLARIGLMVHATAHTLEPGWNGVITLEFFNAGNIALALRPGMRVCAVSFEPLTSPALNPYDRKEGAKYVNQSGPVASRVGSDS